MNHILASTDFTRFLTQVIKRHNSAELVLRSFAFRRGIASRDPCTARKGVLAVATRSRLGVNQGAPGHTL